MNWLIWYGGWFLGFTIICRLKLVIEISYNGKVNGFATLLFNAMWYTMCWAWVCKRWL